MNNLCIFGDSIVWGLKDRQESGWVQRLRKHIEQNNKQYETYNLGICGNTSNDLLQRFYIEAKARNPQIIIISVGINDSAYIIDKDKNIVPIKQYETNIKELITKAKLYTPKIIFVGLTKVEDTKTQPYAESTTGKCYANDIIDKYNLVLNKVVRENNLLFIDVFNLLSSDDISDGLHPNSQGHLKLFEYINHILTDKKFYN